MNSHQNEILVLYLVIDAFYHGDPEHKRRLDYMKRSDSSKAQTTYICYYTDKDGKKKKIYIGISTKFTNELLLDWAKESLENQKPEPLNLFDYFEEETTLDEDDSGVWKEIENIYNEDDDEDDNYESEDE